MVGVSVSKNRRGAQILQFVVFFVVVVVVFFFHKTIIALALVGYKRLRASLAINHLISNARLWNNCLLLKTSHGILQFLSFNWFRGHGI